MKNINPTKAKAWEKLNRHFQEIKDLEMKQLFAENPARANELTLHWEDFYLDLSKNRITETTQKIQTTFFCQFDQDFLGCFCDPIFA